MTSDTLDQAAVDDHFGGPLHEADRRVAEATKAELDAVMSYGRAYADEIESDELDAFLDTLMEGAHHA